jgi:hypothetical protein
MSHSICNEGQITGVANTLGLLQRDFERDQAHEPKFTNVWTAGKSKLALS